VRLSERTFLFNMISDKYHSINIFALYNIYYIIIILLLYLLLKYFRRHLYESIFGISRIRHYNFAWDSSIFTRILPKLCRNASSYCCHESFVCTNCILLRGTSRKNAHYETLKPASLCADRHGPASLYTCSFQKGEYLTAYELAGTDRDKCGRGCMYTVQSSYIISRYLCKVRKVSEDAPLSGTR